MVLMVAGLSLPAQKGFQYEKNTAALEALLEKVKKEDAERDQRVNAYLKEHPKLSRSQQQAGHNLYLYDIENGRPVYLTSHNQEAAENLGVPAVREGGRLGLNLTGKNLKVHVWDSGTARFTHQEYQGRLKNSESGEEDDHATHVVGTMMAGGIEPRARGFAYEAEAEAYFWDNDDQEIIQEVLDEGIIISNHSYGLRLGWDGNGQWQGNESVSSEEDYRFGFYSSNARTFDDIAFNSPYYTIVKSAGNDRGDSGDGTHPPDGPFDCIGDFGVAKNVITIGAVRKLSGDYTQPSDITMSSFSGWGPVDDGRIKPDFVAPGVSLFSCTSESDESYGIQSGTSMASPAAAASLALINEAYLLLHNTFLRAASLKALAMNTAMEAGSTDGPDYQFGWGMIDVEKAVEFIVEEDRVNKFILEETLLDQDTFTLEINPVADQKITVSLAWTDPAGSPVSPALDPTDLMLVNDLDMRIVDEVGNEVAPWILDPTKPGLAARRGDNFRDNSEKIEFSNPEPRRYFVKVFHKGSLENGRQDFSLVLDYTSEDPGTENLYWVNNAGSWNETSQWSPNSGGNAAGITPATNNKLIFDDNSFSGAGGTVTMDQNYEVAGIVALSSKNIVFDLGGNTLTVRGSALIASPNFQLQNGTILLENEDGDQSYIIDLDQTPTAGLNLTIGANNRAAWLIQDNDFQVDQLSLLGGDLSIVNSTLTAGEWELGPVSGMADLQLSGATLRNPQRIVINEVAWQDDSLSTLLFDQMSLGAEIVNIQTDLSLAAKIQATNSQVTISGLSLNLQEIALENATLAAEVNLLAESLSLSSGSALQLDDNIQFLVENDLDIISSTEAPVAFTGLSAGNRGVLNITSRQKFCFDYLDVANIDLAGNASVSIGLNSTLANADGWSEKACEDLLFADFSVEYLCAGALALLNNNSDGVVAGQSWFVNNELISNDLNASYTFPDPGTYLVRLEVTDDEGVSSAWEETVEVVETTLEDNYIVQNPTQLASFRRADSYQWYKDGQPLEGETSRVYLYNGEPGLYFVLTFDDQCNRKSDELDLRDTQVENLDRSPNPLVRFYPVPVQDRLFIEIDQNYREPVEISLRNTLGQEMLRTRSGGQSRISLDLSNLPPGLYVCVLRMGEEVFSKKVLKE